MPKGREELRRGLRSLIEVTSREMEALADESQARTEDDAGGDKPDRPILKLVRETAPRSRPAPEPESLPEVESVPSPVVVAAPTPPVVPAAPVPTAPSPAAPVPATPVHAVPVPASQAAAARPAPVSIYGIPTDASGVHPKKGVCAAYYVNHACWEVPEAYCNQALQVCMLRDCPVYNLNREELERRFAAKFAHLW